MRKKISQEGSFKAKPVAKELRYLAIWFKVIQGWPVDSGGDIKLQARAVNSASSVC